MATSLAQIRAKLKEQENNRTAGASNKSADKTLFAHWNMDEGASSRVRFVADADPNNPFFWVEKQMIKLPFTGILGQADSKPFILQVPCVEMWSDGGKCPILAEVRTWFKDASMEELGRKYWKKKSYLFQGFVRENSLADDESPENPIRKFVFGSQIFNIVKASILDPEMEEIPTHTERGLDFQIVKTSKGQFADYSTSKWARKESALSPTEEAAIEQFGLFNLADWLPKRPGDVELKVMKEMFEASVDGELYDLDRWGEYFRPYGVQTTDTDDSVKAKRGVSVPVSKPAAPAPAKVEETTTVAEDDAPFDVEDTATKAEPIKAPAASNGNGNSNKKAEDILAMIRNRNKQ